KKMNRRAGTGLRLIEQLLGLCGETPLHFLGKTGSEEDAKGLNRGPGVNVDGVNLVLVQDKIRGFIDQMVPTANRVMSASAAEGFDRKPSCAVPVMLPGLRVQDPTILPPVWSRR